MNVCILTAGAGEVKGEVKQFATHFSPEVTRSIASIVYAAHLQQLPSQKGSIASMESKSSSEPNGRAANLFTTEDVFEILVGHAWVDANPTPSPMDWIERATALLGPQASSREHLRDLLTLIFQYDAVVLLQRAETHAVLSRQGARQIIRELALLLLEGGDLDSDRFKEIVNVLKTRLAYRSRELFLPIRLALAGRAGGGELDRVILLLDSAALADFSVAVKGARRRIIEFCAALD